MLQSCSEVVLPKPFNSPRMSVALPMIFKREFHPIFLLSVLGDVRLAKCNSGGAVGEPVTTRCTKRTPFLHIVLPTDAVTNPSPNLQKFLTSPLHKSPRRSWGPGESCMSPLLMPNTPGDDRKLHSGLSHRGPRLWCT